MDDGRIELWDLAEKPLGKLRSMTTKGRCSEGATASAGETISWDTQKVALLRNLSVLRSNSFFANCSVGIFNWIFNRSENNFEDCDVIARMWRHDMSWHATMALRCWIIVRLDPIVVHYPQAPVFLPKWRRRLADRIKSRAEGLVQLWISDLVRNDFCSIIFLYDPFVGFNMKGWNLHFDEMRFMWFMCSFHFC